MSCPPCNQNCQQGKSCPALTDCDDLTAPAGAIVNGLGIAVCILSLICAVSPIFWGVLP